MSCGINARLHRVQKWVAEQMFCHFWFKNHLRKKSVVTFGSKIVCERKVSSLLVQKSFSRQNARAVSFKNHFQDRIHVLSASKIIFKTECTCCQLQKSFARISSGKKCSKISYGKFLPLFSSPYTLLYI